METLSSTPRVGYGSRLAQTPVGFTFSVPPQPGNFKHPFRPFLVGRSLQFTKGIVIGTTQSYEPVITGQASGKGVPISGVNGANPPALPLDASVLAPGTTETWACIEFTPNADGTTDANTVVQMVHRASPFADDAKVARCPVCLIVWQGNNPGQVFSLLYFNVRYFASAAIPGPAGGAGVRQYFFL